MITRDVHTPAEAMALAIVGAHGRYPGLRVVVFARYIGCKYPDNYRVTIIGPDEVVEQFLSDEKIEREHIHNSTQTEISSKYHTVQ